MFVNFLPFRCRWNSRRLVAAGALLIYTLVASGLPLPVPSRLSLNQLPLNTDERFPCESCGCGCSSSEQCWSKCCCHSLEENLAWARREGVRPPDFSLAQARQRGLDTQAWDGPAGRAKIVLASAKSLPKPLKQISKKCCCCCGKGKAATTCDVPPIALKPGSLKKNKTIVAWRALACQGISYNWLTIGVATPPPSRIICPPLFPAGFAMAIHSETAESLALPPDPPPPKQTVLIA